MINFYWMRKIALKVLAFYQAGYSHFVYKRNLVVNLVFVSLLLGPIVKIKISCRVSQVS